MATLMHPTHYIPSHRIVSFHFFISTSLIFPALTHTGLSVHHVPLTVFPLTVVPDVHRLSAWIDKLSPTSPAVAYMHAFSFNVLDYDPSMYRSWLIYQPC